MENYSNWGNPEDWDDDIVNANKAVDRLEKTMGRKDLLARIYSGMWEVAQEEAEGFDNNHGLDEGEQDEWTDQDYMNWDEHILDVMFDNRSNTDGGAYDELFNELTEEERELNDSSFLGSALKNYYIQNRDEE